MARRKRSFTTFNLSFLDIMSCGFGAVVLVFLIIDHSIEAHSQDLNKDLLSEVNLLEEDIADGEEGLVKLRNTLSELDMQMVEAQGRGTRITEEIEEYEALIEALRGEHGVQRVQPPQLDPVDDTQPAQQRQRAVVGPVRVFQHQQQRGDLAERRAENDYTLKKALLL